jgi:hypothetical protein
MKDVGLDSYVSLPEAMFIHLTISNIVIYILLYDTMYIVYIYIFIGGFHSHGGSPIHGWFASWKQKTNYIWMI